MAPFRSSLARSAAKLLGVANQADLSLRGATQGTRKKDKFNISGGTLTTPGNGYRYRFFTVDSSDKTLTIADGPGGTLTLEYLMVAGGGQGGGNGFAGGGGGGAGGVLTGPRSIGPGSFPFTIGAGGSGGNQAQPGVDGGDTTAFGLTAYGGGGGGYSDTTTVSIGGAGGGGGAYSGGAGGTGLNPSTPSPIISSDFPGESHPYGNTQGYPGGNGTGRGSSGPHPQPGGGGGGAGAAGGGVDNGVGGVGVVAFSGDTGVPTDYGTPGPSAGRWFAGGGGGGIYPNPGGNPKAGGAGGGGGGAVANGTAHTGGGGRGGSYPSGGESGTGGSGIVIVKYPAPETNS